MNIFESIGSCLNDTVQSLVEKNRVKAQINRLRLVMRSEAKTINKAYIQLGKEYYKKIKDGEIKPSDESEEYCTAIVKATDRFKRAVSRYHELIDSQVIEQENPEIDEDDGEDITLCCSYEDENNPQTSSAQAPDTESPVESEEEISDEVVADDKPADESIEDVKKKIEEMIDISSSSEKEE